MLVVKQELGEGVESSELYYENTPKGKTNPESYFAISFPDPKKTLCKPNESQKHQKIFEK